MKGSFNGIKKNQKRTKISINENYIKYLNL